MSRLTDYADSIAKGRVMRLCDHEGTSAVPAAEDVPSSAIQDRFPWWAHDDAENRAAFETAYRGGWGAALTIELRNPTIDSPVIKNGYL